MLSFEAKARIGGDGAPVRFRLSLRRAELQIRPDIEGRAVLLPSSTPVFEARRISRKKTQNQTSSSNASIGTNVGTGGATVLSNLSATGTNNISLQDEADMTAIDVLSWPNEKGYSLKFSPNLYDGLDGNAVQHDQSIVSLHWSERKKSAIEPEATVEVSCLREDLIIENIEFAEKSWEKWKNIHRNKQVVVEQYIREEIVKDMRDPFSRVVIADAVTEEIHDV